jgi:hypothetical protein
MMGTYPMKVLIDENNQEFVPWTTADCIHTNDGLSFEEKFATKLGKDNLKQGNGIIITEEDNNCVVSVDFGATDNIIDNLDTTVPGQGPLDARQGNKLKNMIPVVVDDLKTADANKALSANQGVELTKRAVPEGGLAGQVLKKASDDNHELEWGDAADPNAIVGDGSIMKIIELTYAEYKTLETNGELKEDTEYHITDIENGTATYITEGQIQTMIDNTTKDYLPLSGGVMTGVLTAPSGLNMSQQKFGMSLGNSDLVECNGIFFGDPRNTSEEGLHYERSNGNYDTLYALDGNLYLSVNNSLQTDGTSQLIPSCSPWQSFTFHNSAHFDAYTTSSSSGYSKAAYRKVGDCVMLKGLITIPGTLEDCSEEICKITDASCIPKYKAYFTVACSINENPNGKAVTVTLGTDGILRVHACDVGGWISLDGVMLPLNN